jgi:tripartite-type tricarboxylate transporter receptor subunit TctC
LARDLAPKGTPADVVARLNGAIVSALADKSVQARFLELGQETPAPTSRRRRH